MPTWRKVEFVFVAICCVCAVWVIIALVSSCTTVTVMTGGDGTTVSSESDKGVIIKPRPGN